MMKHNSLETLEQTCTLAEAHVTLAQMSCASFISRHYKSQSERLRPSVNPKHVKLFSTYVYIILYSHAIIWSGENPVSLWLNFAMAKKGFFYFLFFILVCFCFSKQYTLTL